jgi:hypothetical protein
MLALLGTMQKELQPEERFSAAWTATHERGPAPGQSSTCDAVEALDAGLGLLQRGWLSGLLARLSRPDGAHAPALASRSLDRETISPGLLRALIDERSTMNVAVAKGIGVR